MVLTLHYATFKSCSSELHMDDTIRNYIGVFNFTAPNSLSVITALLLFSLFLCFIAITIIIIIIKLFFFCLLFFF